MRTVEGSMARWISSSASTMAGAAVGQGSGGMGETVALGAGFRLNHQVHAKARRIGQGALDADGGGLNGTLDQFFGIDHGGGCCRAGRRGEGGTGRGPVMTAQS